MTQLVLGRLVRLVGVWLGVLTLSFAVRPLAPGDPVDALLFGQPSSPQTVATLRARFGLDQPLYVQYPAYLSGVVRGDLGISFSTRRPVAKEIGDRFWNTLLLPGSSRHEMMHCENAGWHEAAGLLLYYTWCISVQRAGGGETLMGKDNEQRRLEVERRIVEARTDVERRRWQVIGPVW